MKTPKFILIFVPLIFIGGIAIFLNALPGNADRNNLSGAAVISADGNGELFTPRTAVQESEFCGNNIVDQITEECDGSDLNGKTCEFFGHSGGTLNCDGRCKIYNDECTNDDVGRI